MATPTIPLNVDQRFVERLYGKDERGEKIVDDVIDGIAHAVGLVRHGLESSIRNHEAINANPMLTAARRMADSRNRGFAVIAAPTKTLDTARENALHEIERLEASMRPPAVKDSLGAEIRSAWRSASPTTRTAMMDAAVKAGIGEESALISALTGEGALGLVTGIAPAERAVMIAGWRNRHHKATMERVVRLKQAIADAESIGSAALNFLDKMTDGQAVAEAEAAEVRALAAMKDSPPAAA